MEAKDLTLEQIELLGEKVRRMAHYLYRVRQRMEQRRFRSDDEIFRQVQRTHAAAQELWLSLHYLACDKHRGK